MSLVRVLPRFRKAARAMETLRSRESWSREQIESYQLQRLNAVWAHAREQVGYYRRLAVFYGIPSRFESLDQFKETVPRLSRDAVRADRDDYLSDRAARGTWKLTGGSTGVPTYCYWEHEAYREALRAKYRFWQSWGVGIFDRAVFLWGHGASILPGLRGHMARLRRPIEDRLRNRLRLSAYRLGPDELSDYLRQIEIFRPSAIYAYSTAAFLLAQEALRRGFDCDSLKFLNVCAEPAYPHMIETIERAFGVPAINEYGSIECGFLAGEAPDRTLRVRDDIAIMETLPRGDGQFDIVVTGLLNHSFPLIRYNIGDTTDEPLGRPATGLSILKNICGRANDALQCRSGRRLHPVWLLHLVEQRVPGIRRYRIHQHRDGSVSVDLELNEGRAIPDTSELKRTFEEHLDGYAVKIAIVPSIPQSPAGKHRWIQSDLAEPSDTVAAPDDEAAPIATEQLSGTHDAG